MPQAGKAAPEAQRLAAVHCTKHLQHADTDASPQRAAS
jgi:hypothetical protein